MKLSNLKQPLLVVFAVTLFISCKKSKCKDEWPDGFEFYETSAAKSNPVCSTPILKGWIKQNPNSSESVYSMQLTPQQGVADIFIYSTATEQFQSGDSFTSNSSGNKISTLFISANVQYDANGSQISWSGSNGQCTISAFDSSTLKISCDLSYTLNSNTGLTNSYQMILTDYTIPFNPH